MKNNRFTVIKNLVLYIRFSCNSSVQYCMKCFQHSLKLTVFLASPPLTVTKWYIWTQRMGFSKFSFKLKKQKPYCAHYCFMTSSVDWLNLVHTKQHCWNLCLSHQKCVDECVAMWCTSLKQCVKEYNLCMFWRSMNKRQWLQVNRTHACPHTHTCTMTYKHLQKHTYVHAN